MKKNKVFILFVALVVLLVCFHGLSVFLNPAPLVDPHIFETILECENIELMKEADAVVTKYDTPDKDIYLKGLPYNDFYVAEYTSPEFSFAIYAYEFENLEISQQYYENVTGMSTELNRSFHGTVGMFSYELVVYDSTRAYFVKSLSIDSVKVEEFIGDVFPNQLKSPNEP